MHELKYKTIKRFGKIIGRVFLALFLTLYVVVALLNYSLVQSFAGSAAGSILSRQSGGEVRIGSLALNPFNHLLLHNVLLATPEGDTVCSAATIACRFRKFPIDGKGLTVERVRVKDTYYHLASDSSGLNLHYLLDLFKPDHKKPDTPKHHFIINVGELVLQNVHYRQDLKEHEGHHYAGTGVDIPHMEYRDVNGRLRNIRVDGDHVTCRFDHFSAKERSGLEVRNICMDAYVSSGGIAVTNMILETADSHLEGDVLLDFRHWETMKHYVDSVYMTCRFLPGSYGGLRDAGYWTHALWGMDERVDLQGYFCGPVQDLRVDSVLLAFGESSTVSLDAYIYGLPNIDTTLIGGNVHRLHTTYSDLAAVKHPAGITMKAEQIVKQLDVIDLSATFSGTVRNFLASLDLQSSAGDLRGDLRLAIDPVKHLLSYSGKASSDGFNIGKVAPNEWLSRGAFNINFDGSGTDPKTMTASAEGTFRKLVLKNQHLHDDGTLTVEADRGIITAAFAIDDTLLSLDAQAKVQYRENGPYLSADADIRHTDLCSFGLWPMTEDSVARVDAHLHAAHMQLSDRRTLLRALVQDLHLQTPTKNYRLKNATLTAREQNHYKTVTLNSDILTSRLTGYFNYDALGFIVKKFVNDYVPSGLGEVNKSHSLHYDRVLGSNFELTAEWIDSTRFLETFLPQLVVARGTSLQFNYNDAEWVKTLLRSDSIGFGAMRFYNIGANGEAVAQRYKMRLSTDEVRTGNFTVAERADLDVETSREDAACRLQWNNDDATVGDGNVALRLVSDSGRVRLLIDPSTLLLAQQEWTLGSGGDIWFSDGGLRVDDLSLSSLEQQILVNVSRLRQPDDEVTVDFSHFGLSLLNPILQAAHIEAAGNMDGQLFLSGFSDIPYMNATLKVNDMHFNEMPLGDARIVSTWNQELNQLNLYLNTDRLVEDNGSVDHPLWISGYAALGGESPQLEFQGSLESVDMQCLQPFLKSFSSDFGGTLNADFEVGGTLATPRLSGYVAVDDGALLVDFLNVRYAFSDTIYLDTTRLRLDQFTVYDSRGDSAHLNGSVFFEKLSDLRLDLSLASDRFLCMNTGAMNATYFGTVEAAVDGTVQGPVDDIGILLNARTLPGSTLTIPIDNSKQVKTADYIHFVGDEDPYEEYVATLSDPEGPLPMPAGSIEQDGARYHLIINVDATPDLMVQLPINLDQVGVDIHTRGDGDLQLGLSTESPFSLLGDYELNTGTVTVDMLGLIEKEFSIDEGSTITFPGSISDIRFDIDAVYSQRVNLSTLTGTLSSTDTQKPITVENVITIDGTLQNPELDFDLRLPNADQSVQEEVFAYIDRNNERDMLNQTFSLLVLGQFYNSSTSSNTGTTSVADMGYGQVANVLGSLVSGMVDFVDLNFEYNAGNELATEQYSVDISREWKKFYFESTLGFGGEAREMSQVNNTNMTGDVLVGYKINPRLHLFVFNRSNTNDYTRSDLPYKQGVGLKYTRDFDRLSELFRRNK